MKTIPPVVDERWAVSKAEWSSLGGDYVFVCRAADRSEHWFRLRRDLACALLDLACEQSTAPYVGLLAAYREGLGPDGDQPWIADDFELVIRQIDLPTDAALEASRGPELVKARDDLRRFLRARSADLLIVDDGSGSTREFTMV